MPHCGKHLHGRGEDLRSLAFTRCGSETPPRTWRRRRAFRSVQKRIRNTSTDVEKTSRLASSEPASRKHLHGRGEDAMAKARGEKQQETPPRTWRRRKVARATPCCVRNTSTDVEKTRDRSDQPRRRRKHLHGRGEDQCPAHASVSAQETPPRTWRRRERNLMSANAERNTSTDVEKTKRNGIA